MSLHVLSKLMVTLANFDLQFLNNVITCIIKTNGEFLNKSLHVLSKLMVTLANFDLQFLNNVITCIIKTNGDFSQFWFTVPK